jgi:tetratricopeptide (TPR) repeat protein/transglutaminase-like putative cysteine protease
VVPACLSLLGAPLAASTPWDEAPAFTATAAELLQASRELPIQARHAVQELLEDSRVTLDEAGRRTTVYRYVFRLDRESALEGWGTVKADYATWLEDKPQIRARVITPDGQEHLLDPATIGEFSPEQNSPELFTDRRQLRAPLPKLTKGALAEVEIITRDHRPFSRAGAQGSCSLWQAVPVLRTRFTLDVPAAAPLQWKLKGLQGIQARPQLVAGRRLLSLDLGPSQPGRKEEPNQAPDQNPHPAVLYSTTPTWAAAAAEYADIVETQLKGASLQAWVKQALGSASGRMEVIQRLVARVHKEVRYTGLEFGEASVVPRAPGDTLKRGYGDCKDKAALLVAVLREAGVPAQLALLRAGSRWDVEAALPGLAAFDHAIVYVPGPPELWIDPTVPTAAVGELPAGDLQRRALVIGAASPGLLTTPGTSPEANLNRETKEVFLAEDGPGRILETTEATGPSGVYLRGQYAGVDPLRTRESLKGYAERAFKAKDLGRLEYLDPEDLTRPFRLVLEAGKAGIASTGPADAAVALNAWPLVNSLNEALKAVKDEDPEEDEAAGAPASPKADPPRRTDLQLWAPYALEARWIIHPPVGYANDTLPGNQILTFGPATLSLSYQSGADGLVEAAYRLACPKRRWSPAEVDQGRAALKAFGESKIPMVVFQQVGEARLGAGQVREALAEFRALQAAAPGKADPLIRMARAQLAAGLAETARTSLEQAIRLDPNSSVAFQVLGWVLQHDWLGRQFRPGWDRAGALAAYRKAVALDPKNRFARQNLAVLLEHSDEGERYLAGPDLQEAIGLYQALLAEEKSDGIQDNLMVALARQGRLAEAQEVARQREASPRRQAWLVGLEACLKGLEPALALGRILCPDLATRRTTYLGAADVAVNFRKYAEAAALLNEGASGSADLGQIKARAENLAKVHQYPGGKLDLKDPANVVRAMLLTLGERHLTRDRLKSFVAEGVLTPAQVRKADREQRKVRLEGSRQGWSVPLMVDLSLSLCDIAVDGDEHKGYLVRFQRQGQNPSATWVARLGDSCRLVGDQFYDLARQALWSARHGDLPQARAMLDLLVEASLKPDPSDPLSGNVIRPLWAKGRQGSAGEIQLAASCLLALDKDEPEPEAMAAVLAAMKTELPPAILYTVLNCAAMGAGARKDLATQDEASARLLALLPDSLIAKNGRLDYLGNGQHWQEALAAVDALIARYPDEAYLPTRKLFYLSRLARWAEVETLMAERIARGQARPSDYNTLAWSRVVRGKLDAQAVDYARRAILGTGASSSAAHHTLATVLAEAGRTAEALDFLLKAVALRDEGKPTGAEWYVLGRIAEQLQETAAAAAYYRRVALDPGEPGGGEDSVAALARRRLAVLAKD